MILNRLIRIPIFHIASMARSGETLLLRSLAAHPKVKVVHNLADRDSEDSARFFEFLQGYQRRSIRAVHPLAKPYATRRGDVFVLKQGVWEHPAGFDGVILARNPVAILASLAKYDAPRDPALELDAQWDGNRERLVRWMGSIDAGLLPEFKQLHALEQFCAFYNRRMGALLATDLPIVHYERLVTSPRDTLEFVMTQMGLDYSDALTQAHASYESGQKGHGQIDLGKPINRDSLYRYQQIIKPEEFDQVVVRTRDVAERYGYEMSWDRIEVQGDA